MDGSAGDSGAADPAEVPVDAWDAAIVLETQRHAVPAEVRDARMGGVAEYFCVSDLAPAIFAGAGPFVSGEPGAVGTGRAAYHADPAVVDRCRRAAFRGVFPGIPAD